MKITKSLIAAAVVMGSAVTAQATTFAVSGALTANNGGSVYVPTAPTFNGAMNFTASNSLAAGSFFMAPHTVYASGGVYSNPAEEIVYGSRNGIWNGNVLIFSGIATNSNLPGSSCTGYCEPVVGRPGLMDLTLTFSDSEHFSGVAHITLTNYYDYTTTYTMSGSAVPVPAAAWLFGSGLLGLSFARRRRTL